MRKKKNKKNADKTDCKKSSAQSVSSPGPFFEKPLLIAAGLFLLVSLTYYRALQNDFTYDDFSYVTGNDYVQQGLKWPSIKWAFTTWQTANWHPLTWLSHMLDCQIFGLHSWGHHLTNVLLHAFNTSLIFFVLRKMTGRTWPSTFVAALFGVHPLHVESVAWVAERKDVLSTMFWMLSLWAYAGFVEELKTSGAKNKRYYTFSFVFLALGLMCKPMLVSAPFLMLLLDYWPLHRWKQKQIISLLLEKVPFFLLAIISAILAFLAQKREGAMVSVLRLPLDLRVENTLISYILYLYKLLCPVHLVVIYPYPDHLPVTEVLVAGLVILGIWIFVFIQRRARPFLFVGWAWFFGTLIPVIGLVQVGVQSMADRYTYVPAIGIFIAVTWWAAEWAQSIRYRALVPAVCVIIILGEAGLTLRQIGYWKNDEMLFGHAIAVTRNNAIACMNLGDYEFNQGQLDKAMDLYREAEKFQPQNPLVYKCLGLLFQKEGRLSEAITQYQIAISLDAHSSVTHYNLALALEKNGNLDMALSQLEQCIKLDPNSSEAHNELGRILGNQGQFDLAINEFREAIRLKPDYTDAQRNLSLALKLKGDSPPGSNAPPPVSP